MNIDITQQVIRNSNLLRGRIFVKFDDPNAGNSLKDSRLRDVYKHCVPITAVTATFPYRYGSKTITVQRKQFPLILAHAMTIHKSQGSTLEYMLGDLDGTTEKGPNCASVRPG